MRPDRRFGIGRAIAAGFWLALAGSGSMALGQGWEAEPVDPKGHVGEVVAVARVRQTLATAGSDGLAKVWELVDPDLLTVRLEHRVDLVGHVGKVLAVALSPEGSIVATGGSDRTVRLWDAARGTPLATLQGHSGAVEALAFSPGGTLLVSGGLDTAIRLWDVDARKVSKTIQGHEQGVRGLAFAPDGQSIASCGRDHSVRLWDVAKGIERTLGHHDAPAWSVAFSPDGKTVASGGLDKMVRLWRVDEATVAGPSRMPPQRPVRAQVQLPGGALVVDEPIFDRIIAPPQPNEVHTWPAVADVVAVSFTPDGHYVAAAVSDLAATRTTPGSVAFFAMPPVDPNQPGPLTTLRATIRGHLGPILGLGFDRVGSSVATVGGDASVRVWNASVASPMAASTGRTQPEAVEARTMIHLDPVEALAISPDGRRVATAGGSAGVSLWDPSTRTLIGRLKLPTAPRSVPTTGDPFAVARAVAFSPDGKTLATGGDGKAVSLWEAETGRSIGTLKGHLGGITTLAFSPDGQALASGSKDASVTLWDVVKMAEVVVLARHTSAVTALAFGPDGKSLASASLDYTVKLWDLPSGRFVTTLDAHKDVVGALAFAPDGKTLASADRSGMLRVWDVASKLERSATKGSSGPLHALAISPDGQSLVGGAEDGSIHRWDLSDGKAVALRRGAHAGPILAIAFGPGGKTLATGGADRELKLWDVDARLAPGPFAGLEGKVQQIAVSADGKALATVSDDQFARVWDVATGKERFAPIHFEAAEARVAFSPDGKTLALLPVGPGEPASLWDLATGRPRRPPAGDPPRGSALAFSPDGQTWATAAGATVGLWDVGTSRRPQAPPDVIEASGEVRSLAFSPDGKALVAVLADGSVERLDQGEQRKDTRIVPPSNNPVVALAFSPDGRSIALGGLDRAVRVLDFEKESVRLTLRGPRRSITGLAFSPDGKLVASASDGEPTLFVWDAASGKVVSNPTLPGAPSGEGLACLAFSADGKILFAGGDRGVVTFDMTEGHRLPSRVARAGPKAGQERATLRGHAAGVRHLAFAGGGSKLVSRDDDGVVKVWDLLDGNRDRWTFGAPDFPAQAMAVRPDGKALAVALRLPANRLRQSQAGDVLPPRQSRSPGTSQRMSDEVKVWDLESGEGRGMINSRATAGGVDRVAALAYSLDGRSLATSSQKGLVRSWDSDSLDSKTIFDAIPRPADVVQFSPDGKTLAGVNASGEVTLWDAETGQVRARLTHDGGINQMSISPDGRLVATAGGHVDAGRMGPRMDGAPPDPPTFPHGPGSGGDVRLWDLATGRRLGVLPMESGPVARIAFSPDGKSLAASTTRAIATLWDVDSARPVVTLAWPSGEARSLAFAPDGKALAIGGEDQALRVWDVPDGTLRAERLGHTDTINWVAYSPDGKTIATAGRDGTIKLWDSGKD